MTGCGWRCHQHKAPLRDDIRGSNRKGLHALKIEDEQTPEEGGLEHGLTEARAHLASGRSDLAMERYAALLRLPPDSSVPDLQRRALIDLAMLCLGRADARHAVQEKLMFLGKAIDLLHRARPLIESNAALSLAVLDTNLALAYARRYEIAPNAADALQASLRLDGAERIMRDAGEPGLADWAANVRLFLDDLRGRHRKPR